jgi:hypothetical protein
LWQGYRLQSLEHIVPVRLAKHFADFRESADGSIAILFSLALPVVLGTAALAIDSAKFYRQEAKLQTVADSIALAAAKELHLYQTKPGELEASAKVRAEAMMDERSLRDTPHEIEIGASIANRIVQVRLSSVAESFLPGDVWGDNPIVARSTARAFGESKLCVLALNGNKSDAVKGDESASVAANGCAVQSNSSDSTGIHLAGGSSITASIICSSGGTKGSDSAYNPSPMLDCPPLDDPLADRTPPPAGGCDFRNLTIDGGSETLSPGHYCEGLKISNKAQIRLEPGVYVFSGGKLEVDNESTLEGDYVSFYFADDAAIFIFKNESVISLSAPKDGPMAGILMFENPAAAEGRDFLIESGQVKRLLGTIYLPQGTLKIDAKGAVAAESAYTVIIADRLDVKNANLVVNSDYGGTDVPVPEGVGPHSSQVTLDR